MSPEEITNIAIYTRVSTAEQAEGGFSLDNQLDKLRSFCAARDFNIAGEYVEAGESGTTTKRPEYQRMFKDFDKWDGILVYKMDRIHRSQLNFTQMMAILQKQDKHFVSMTESYDTSTAIGRLLMDFAVRLAQFESEQTGERTYTGMVQKARDLKAGWNGGKPPFGYRVIDGKFKPIKEDLILVKKAYEMYMDETINLAKIAKILGRPYSSIQFWLKNPIYAGWYRWSNVIKKFDVDPIISPILFNQVQKRKSKMDNRLNPSDNNIHGDPLLIPIDKDVVEFSRERIKAIPSLKKPKHIIKH